jgi:hypothetical protein
MQCLSTAYNKHPTNSDVPLVPKLTAQNAVASARRSNTKRLFVVVRHGLLVYLTRHPPYKVSVKLNLLLYNK